MLKASIPARFNIVWAAGAGGSFTRAIPQASQIGINAGFASLTDGFPPLNFTPVGAGGVPPFGQDFNGILNQITAWSQWFEAGGPISYDSTFATGASGGYPQGAIVQSNVVPGRTWMSTIDNNASDPDAITAFGWVTPPGQNPSGTPIPSFSSTLNPAGFITANGQVIGNTGSAAAVRSPSLLLLFVAIWNEFSNSQCPIYDSGGIPTTRGANPYADFAANKGLTTPSLQGTSLIGVDTMGGGTTTRLAGVPISVGTTTSPTSTIGENLHSLVNAENGNHAHANTASASSSSSFSSGNAAVPIQGTTVPGSPVSAALQGNNTSGGTTLNAGVTGTVTTTTTVTMSNASSGSGTAHNTVQLGIGVYWNLAK